MTKPKPPKLPRCPYCHARMKIEPCLINTWAVYCNAPRSSKVYRTDNHGWFERRTRAAAIRAAGRRK